MRAPSNLEERSSGWVAEGIITHAQQQAILDADRGRSRRDEGFLPRSGLRAELFVLVFGTFGILSIQPWNMAFDLDRLLASGIPLLFAGLALLLVFPRHRVIADTVLFTSLVVLSFAVYDVMHIAAAGPIAAALGASIYLLRITRVVVASLAGLLFLASIGVTFSADGVFVIVLGLIGLPIAAVLALKIRPTVVSWWKTRSMEREARRRKG